MSDFYTCYSCITAGDGDSIDLSAFFSTPGVADITQLNIGWRLVDTHVPCVYYSGTVTPDGSLTFDPDFPAPYIFTDDSGYPGYIQLQIEYTPDPSKCAPGNGSPTGQHSGPASVTTPHSVELATGRFVFEQPLMSVAALGAGSWNFGLNYKSNFGVDGILGKNFAYPQYMFLIQLAPYGGLTNIELITNQLLQEVFTDNGSGTYPAAPGNNSGCTLVANGSGSSARLLLTAPNGTVVTFFGFNGAIAMPGQIEKIVDRYKNTQTFTWAVTDGFLQLLNVTDSYGRSANYSYYGEELKYRLKRISDYTDRHIDFQYDNLDHLIAVITPSIHEGVESNTFPGGTAYVFQYDIGNSDPFRRDDLIKIWFPNETQSYVDETTRTVDVAQVYANATPRYRVTYGQNVNDPDTYGKVLTETLGDSKDGTGGTSSFAYTTQALPANLIDPTSAGDIVSRTSYTDRNGNLTIYDFNAYWTVSRFEVALNRSKSSLELDNEDTGGVATPPFVTWTKYNAQNQPLVIVYPEGNSTEYTYEDGAVPTVPSYYVARLGLLRSETRLPGNSVNSLNRGGSGGGTSPELQTRLTKRYFYEPIFNQLCAIIEERGNPVNGGDYYPPQNLGDPSTNADRDRYTTLYTFDYQKDLATVVSGTAGGDHSLPDLLHLTSAQIEALITFVDDQMTNTTGTGGITTGFPMGLGNINGDGTGNGMGTNATHLGNVVKITYPSVLLIATGYPEQERIELFTVNLRGQVTTATDPEGNLTVHTRYPVSDPQGTGKDILTALGSQQYGHIRETHLDANPNEVMSLVGAPGDLKAFTSNIITRTNTPGIYQGLVTRFESVADRTIGAYDAMGNVLAQTDPRGFVTVYDRSEMGEVYRVTSPAPYNFRVETSYDANRNIIQVDTEDCQVQYNSSDPTSAGYGTFTPSGSGTTAHVPMIPGPGGEVRPGWFSNRVVYNILDNKVVEIMDATGSSPSYLATQYRYDLNQNLIEIIKPEGNTVEYDYDERNLKILERVGGPSGAVTAYSYDGNQNLLTIIGPVNHNAGVVGAATFQTIYVTDAFRSGTMLSHTGDWVLQNVYDGFDRVVAAYDAVGGGISYTYDPTSTLVKKLSTGQRGGASPINRTGFGNIILSTEKFRYDEALRLYEHQTSVFMPYWTSGRDITYTGGGLKTNSIDNNHNDTIHFGASEESYVLTRTLYDCSGRTASTMADNTAETIYAYDGAGRHIQMTDPLGNIFDLKYDGKNNPVKVTRIEACTITPPIPSEIFLSFSWYDCLNRVVVAGSQGADGLLTSELNLCCPWQGLPSTLFSLTGYDSRGNRACYTDPKVNVAVLIYDGASRLIETQQEMRFNGDGRNGPVANQTFQSSPGIIRTEVVYDGNGRLIELVDDRGGSTVYAFDLLDRPIKRTLPDSSFSTAEYDLAGYVHQFVDENQSSLTYSRDALGRKTLTTIYRATGVGGTTGQSFEYDGLSRLTLAFDYHTAGFRRVDLYYDSLGRVLEEMQTNTPTWWVTILASTSYCPTQLAYPKFYSNDPAVIATSTYDKLYRLTSVTGTLDDGTVHTLDKVAWEFFGRNRIVETIYGTDVHASNTLIATQMNNARTNSAVQPEVPLPPWGTLSSDELGYDGVGRMITKRYLTGGIDSTTNTYNNTTALVGHTTAHDRTGNKLYERHLEAESRSHLYQPFNSDGSPDVGYDSASRLQQYQRGVLSSATIPYRVNPGASIATPITLPGADQVRTYGLDGVGNWKTSNYTEVGSGGSTTNKAEVRQHNYVNEITSIMTNGGAPTPFAYDHGDNAASSDPQVKVRGNGNLINDGARIYHYDVFNRLIQVDKITGGSPVTIASYIYDALNRRVQKIVQNGGLTGDIPDSNSLYMYNGQQLIQERTESPNVWKKDYFWGQYIDELLFFAVKDDATYRVLSDLAYRSVATTTTSNVIIEAYDCDAYGNTLCYSGPGTDGLWFTNDDVRTNNPVNFTIFTGRQYDPETQIYYYRARHYSSLIGRFLQRDPIGFRGADANLYRYCANNPTNALDPSGQDAVLPLWYGTIDDVHGEGWYSVAWYVGGGLGWVKYFTSHGGPAGPDSPAAKIFATPEPYMPDIFVPHPLIPDPLLTSDTIDNPFDAFFNFLLGGGKQAKYGPHLINALKELQAANPIGTTNTPKGTAFWDFSTFPLAMDSLEVMFTLGNVRYTNDGTTTTITDFYTFGKANATGENNNVFLYYTIGWAGSSYWNSGSYPTPPPLSGSTHALPYSAGPNNALPVIDNRIP